MWLRQLEIKLPFYLQGKRGMQCLESWAVEAQALEIYCSTDSSQTTVKL